MAEVTIEQIEELKTEATASAPPEKLQEVEAYIASKAKLPLNVQHRLLTQLRDTFEAQEIAAFLPKPEPIVINSDGKPQVKATNPWSAEGWNTTKQGALVKSLGEVKAQATLNSGMLEPG